MVKYHNPVLLKESVDALDIDPKGVYVDITFGGGGHSREILKRLCDEGKLFAFDQDSDTNRNKIYDERFVLIEDNFRYIYRFLRFYGINKVNGILGDLGVSSHQLDDAERGFSTRFEANLDMRMNKKSRFSANTVLNHYSEEDLSNIFFKYGELRNSKALAAEIVKERKKEKIATNFRLKEVLSKFFPKIKENKFLAKIFQSIRIEVNQELEALKEFLLLTPKILDIKGRISIISYHSLEDRIVKRFIKNGSFEEEPQKDIYGNIDVPLKSVGKIITPTKEEIKLNNRARSAKLRIAILK